MGHRRRLRDPAGHCVDFRHETVRVDVFKSAEHLLAQPVALCCRGPRGGLQAGSRIRKLRGRGLEDANRDVYLAHGP